MSHEIIYDIRSRKFIDHIPIPEYHKVSESKFASHVHEIHKRISDKVAHNKVNYKLRADIEKKNLKLLLLQMLLNSCMPVVPGLSKSCRN